MNQTAVTILQTVVRFGSETVLLTEKRKVEAVHALKALGLVDVTDKSFQDVPRLVVTIKSPIISI